MANYPRTVKTEREGRCTEITTLDPIFSLSDWTSFAVSIISGLFCFGLLLAWCIHKRGTFNSGMEGGRGDEKKIKSRWETEMADIDTACARQHVMRCTQYGESNTKVLVESRNLDREREREREREIER